jgi:hypothetical protein
MTFELSSVVVHPPRNDPATTQRSWKVVDCPGHTYNPTSPLLVLHILCCDRSRTWSEAEDTRLSLIRLYDQAIVDVAKEFLWYLEVQVG